MKHLRDELTKKFLNRTSDDQEPIAFKFSDGTKIEHNFLTSTIKVGLSCACHALPLYLHICLLCHIAGCVSICFYNRKGQP